VQTLEVASEVTTLWRYTNLFIIIIMSAASRFASIGAMPYWYWHWKVIASVREASSLHVGVIWLIVSKMMSLYWHCCFSFLGLLTLLVGQLKWYPVRSSYPKKVWFLYACHQFYWLLKAFCFHLSTYMCVHAQWRHSTTDWSGPASINYRK